MQLILEEISELLQKGAVGEILTVKQTGFYSNLFLVPKKDGGQIPSNQPESLERICEQATLQNGGHSCTERPPEERGLAGQNRAFFSIPIHINHKKFIFKEKTYMYLPSFRPLLSPMGIHKNSQTSISYPQREGVRLTAYINDLLILMESRELILDHVTGMRYLLEILGFIVNTKKSVLNPAQVIEFLGLSMDSMAMEVRLPAVKKSNKEACKLVQQKSVQLACLHNC